MNDILIKKIFTVSEFTYKIKNTLENTFKIVSIKGEIGNFTKHSSGHIYFNLKDKESQISCALFKRDSFKIKNIPKSGDQIIVEGELSLYPPRGSYQIIVKKIDFVGVGELLLKFHKLKEKLKNKGYFDLENKKKIPPLPKKIGVVTSKTGAVIKDILNVLNRRYSNFHLILNPVRVQGENAKEEIAQAIDDFNKYNLVDVLIIARGGGSLEDLWAFNEEIVADAIFRSKIPTISAVGHETDVTISDLTSDLRAPTPSAAAEIVMSEKNQLLKNIKTYEMRITNSIRNILKYKESNLNQMMKQTPFSSSIFILSKYYQKLDEISNKIDTALKHFYDLKKASFKKLINALNPKNQYDFFTQKLINYSKNLNTLIKNKIFIIKEKMDSLEKLIKTSNPKNILKKGYSILFLKKSDSIILSSKDVKKEDKIYAVLHDGKIEAKVE